MSLNKYYVAARHIGDAVGRKVNELWTKKDLKSAIQHAKEVMEEDDLDTVVIVKMVKVVRRQKTPIVVEDL